MTKIFIIHGTEGSPEVNWFPWLKQELENLGHTVFVPKFPTPEGHSLENWMQEFNDFYFSKVDEDSIIVGHSLGPAFILSLLEKLDLPKPIKASFLVAGFISPIGNEHFDNLNKSFIDKEFNWDKIKQNCEKFYVINSKDDPYVPIERGEELAENLGTGLIVLENAGHINAEAGYTKFDKLLDMLKDELK
jgi:uncharacterized protein